MAKNIPDSFGSHSARHGAEALRGAWSLDQESITFSRSETSNARNLAVQKSLECSWGG